MKIIKVFVASSIVEFEKERIQLADFVRRINDALYKKNQYIYLIQCEALTKQVEKKRKQESYNRIICESDYFFFIHGDKVGQYTEEEYETALQHHKETGNPQIVNCHFSNIYDMKLRFLMAIKNVIAGEISIKGNALFLNQEQILLYDNMNESQKNELEKIDSETIYDSEEEDGFNYSFREINIIIDADQKEFEQEILKMSAFILYLNNIYCNKRLYFRFINCNEWNGPVPLLSIDSKADEEKNCFYTIIGKKVGEDILRIFEAALNAFKENGQPYIYTYFKQLSSEEKEDSVLQFEKRLDEQMGHYYSTFVHFESLKLDILLELASESKVEDNLALKNGYVCIGSEKVLSLDNILLYQLNDELQNSLLELEMAKAEEIQWMDACQDEVHFKKMIEAHHKRENIQKKVNHLEKNMKEQMLAIHQMRREQILTWRAKEASRMLEQGNTKGALALLRDGGRKTELKHFQDNLQKILEKAKTEEIDAVKGYLQENRMAISAIKLTGYTKENIEEIIALYQESIDLEEKYQLGFLFYWNYILFLHYIHYDKEALVKAETLYERILDENAVKDKLLTDVVRLLGDLYASNGKREKAEQFYRQALVRYDIFNEGENNRYINHIIAVKNNLANLLADLSNLNYDEDAKKYKIDRLSKERFEEAERLYRESIEVLETLGEKKAMGLCRMNLATLISVDDKRRGEAEKIIRYEIERLNNVEAITEKERRNNLVDKKDLLMNLAVILTEKNQHQEAEQFYRQALEMAKELFSYDPYLFGIDVAEISFNLANLITEKKETIDTEGESLYKEALRLYREFSSVNPKCLLDITNVCTNYACFLGRDLSRIKDEEAVCLEGITAYEQWKKISGRTGFIPLYRYYKGLKERKKVEISKESIHKVVGRLWRKKEGK